jgi:hypothetical protein
MPEHMLCPKCRSILRLSEKLRGKKVKCPGCGATLTLPGGSAKSKPEHPAFEVVDDERVQETPRRPSRPARAEDEDEPPRKSRVRSRRTDEEEDEERRPRRRRREDDDEEERPRSRRRWEEDEDEEDDWEDEDRARRGQLRRARLGLLLNLIAASLYLGALGMAFLILFIGILSTSLDLNVFALAGLPGMANWVVALVGFGFCLAGPRKYGALGLAIATMAVAVVHLMIVVFDLTRNAHSVEFVWPSSPTNWGAMVTHLTYLADLSDYMRSQLDWINLVTGLLELARLILFLLWIRAAALQVKAYALGRGALAALIVLPSTLGVQIIVNLLFYLIFKNTKVTSLGTLKFIVILKFSIIFLPLIAFVVWYLLLLIRARQVIDR